MNAKVLVASVEHLSLRKISSLDPLSIFKVIAFMMTGNHMGCKLVLGLCSYAKL
jgi:hypothetical protein